jgi:hypothetical protein
MQARDEVFVMTAGSLLDNAQRFNHFASYEATCIGEHFVKRSQK